eukprot:TRINITY_DN3173_c0_g1_i2.p1 TRINITY_DN3173_c0_g1~~TRINITY_DN3173_c0_g1_i2.p1  ORF type:complete len:429 (+),score=169.48 TRINITY_DN3173_c0_g1_i2:85-1287(+)
MDIQNFASADVKLKRCPLIQQNLQSQTSLIQAQIQLTDKQIIFSSQSKEIVSINFFSNDSLKAVRPQRSLINAKTLLILDPSTFETIVVEFENQSQCNQWRKMIITTTTSIITSNKIAIQNDVFDDEDDEQEQQQQNQQQQQPQYQQHQQLKSNISVKTVTNLPKGYSQKDLVELMLSLNHDNAFSVSCSNGVIVHPYDQSDPYILFTFEIQLSPTIKVSCMKRFSEFYSFHKAMQKKLNNLPRMPRKKLFRSTSEEFIVKRGRKLGNYISEFLSNCTSELFSLAKFLSEITIMQGATKNQDFENENEDENEPVVAAPRKTKNTDKKLPLLDHDWILAVTTSNFIGSPTNLQDISFNVGEQIFVYYCEPSNPIWRGATKTKTGTFASNCIKFTEQYFIQN